VIVSSATFADRFESRRASTAMTTLITLMAMGVAPLRCGDTLCGLGLCDWL
jgi:hypothetical protein